MTMPYSPTLLATPQINPVIGGYGIPIPYISPSQYTFAPTAMDVSNMVVNGNTQSQTQALADVIRRSSGLMDRYCFGADSSSKGASLCATMNVEAAYFRVMNGELRINCDYKPIIELSGLVIGTDPSNVAPISPYNASMVTFGRSTIYLPTDGAFVNLSSPSPLLSTLRNRNGKIYCVWSYVNGYPHTSLAQNITAGTNTVVVNATTPLGGVAGIYPGSQLRIADNQFTEFITVQSITGTTITTVAPLLYTHTVPSAPDFLSVTTLPADVEQAAIFMTTYLIKSRGDDAVVLDEIDEPHVGTVSERNEGRFEDMATAQEFLDPYRIVTKIKS